MLNKNLNLSKKILGKEPETAYARNGYGEGVVEAGKADENVVVLCCDLTGSTRSNFFKEEFPKRFVQVGVAEQNMAGIATGMAMNGKVPFCSSYAVFNPGRNWDQVRVSVCYTNANVKIVGAHAGISVGPDGATHQALEDIAITRVLPNMTVVSPCDYEQAKKATIALAGHVGPAYIRFGREKTPVMTTAKTPFELGKAQVFYETKNPMVTVIATGALVYEALAAAERLGSSGIDVDVVNVHTVKPLDEETIMRQVMKSQAVVTVEEHQVTGGLGSAISELLSQRFPVPQEYVGMHDSFGESGSPDELLTKYKMKSKDVVNAVRKVVQRKAS